MGKQGISRKKDQECAPVDQPLFAGQLYGHTNILVLPFSDKQVSVSGAAVIAIG